MDSFNVNKVHHSVTGIIFENHLESEKQGIMKPSLNLYSDFMQLEQQSKSLKYFLRFLENHYVDRQILRSFKKSLIENSQAASLITMLISEKNQKDCRKADEKALMKEAEQFAAVPAPAPADLPMISLEDMPLQSAFASILLNKYMPRQDDDLKILAKEFHFSTIGQSIVSELFGYLADFNSAPLYYDLCGYLSQTESMNVYTEGYEDARNKIIREKSFCARDLETIGMLNQKIDNMMGLLLTSYGDLSDEQKQSIKVQLNGYKLHLEILEQQVSDLVSLLNRLDLSPLGPDAGGAFEILNAETIMPMLKKTEGNVVDGEINVTTGEIKGGFLPFFNTCNSDLQSYGDLAQTQQMAVQLEMAAIQQEWNIVATSLKTLHKIYKGIISDIKR
ncbi:MAG: CT620/CT621 family type III secretion system effector [Victivallaceae bacterium]